MIVLSVVSVLATTLAALVLYGAARALGGRRVSDDTIDIATLVLFRIGALHGLILGLVFAQELAQYQNVINAVTQEVNALTDIYYDFVRYEAPDDVSEEFRSAIAYYIKVAATDEWETLGSEKTLSDEAWAARDVFYTLALDLVPETPRQVSLRQHILDDILVVADLRDARASAAKYTITPMFWIAATFGFILTVLPFFVFPPTPVHVMLLCAFAGYNGMIFAFIFGLSSPFLPPGEVQSTPFITMLDAITDTTYNGRR